MCLADIGENDNKPSELPVPKDVVTPNVMMCSLCQGIVDKYPAIFVCRHCGALGDFYTGIMSDCRYPGLTKIAE